MMRRPPCEKLELEARAEGGAKASPAAGCVVVETRLESAGRPAGPGIMIVAGGRANGVGRHGHGGLHHQ